MYMIKIEDLSCITMYKIYKIHKSRNKYNKRVLHEDDLFSLELDDMVVHFKTKYESSIDGTLNELVRKLRRQVITKITILEKVRYDYKCIYINFNNEVTVTIRSSNLENELYVYVEGDKDA